MFHKELENKDKLIFLTLSELGWELFRWSGFVRKYKQNHPEKIVCAATRENRSDLYNGAVDDIYTFNIDGDYIKFRANMYRLDFFEEDKYKKLIDNIRQKFQGFHIVTMPPYIKNREVFKPTELDHNFTPRIQNKNLIDEIILNNRDKIPICISSRHRIDSENPTRNWKKEYWNDLFEMLKNSNKFIIFILGATSSYVKPIIENNCFFVIEDLVNFRKDVSVLGTTIEAMKQSVLTVGQQSALPILSNYLKIPTIMWGHEKIRHQVKENPMNTRCVFFEELSIHYKTRPELIFNTILKEC
jgi:hypothetical protein